MPFQRLQRLPGIYNDGWYMFFHALFAIALIALVITALVWMIRSMRSSPPPPAAAPQRPPYDPALHEVRMRYARGEIDAQEFQRISTDLSGGAPPPPPPG